MAATSFVPGSERAIPRIVYDHQIFSSQRYGGISRYFVELAGRLAASGEFSVEVLAPYFVSEYLAAPGAGFALTGRKVRSVRYSAALRRRLNDVLTRRRLRARPPALLHETYYARAGLAPRSAKTVLTVYDMIHERFGHEMPGAAALSARKAAAAARADHIICISETTRQDLLARLDVAPDRTSVVYLGAALPRVPLPLPPAASTQLLYVGQRGGYKNFDRLAQALARLRREGLRLTLLCAGGGAFTASEQRALATLELADAVHQADLEDEALARAYGESLCLVYPSCYEGFGIPPLEAMAAGCPVVCSRGGALPEVVADAAEYFAAEDTDSLAQALIRVAGDADRREALRAAGRARLAHFSWERCAADTAAVYRQVLGGAS